MAWESTPEKVFDMIRLYHISSSSSSYLEAFGLNIAESLAMGKPVLATRCGGAEMQIEDGVNGWLVEPNNMEALAEKCKKSPIVLPIIAHIYLPNG